MSMARPRGSRPLRWGLLAVCLCCALPIVADAQPRRNRDRNRLPGGRPSHRDPTDPKLQDEASRRLAAQYMRKGQQLLAKGQFQKAASQFKSVIELVGIEGQGVAAVNQLKDIHRRGMASLNKALELYKNQKYRQALKLAKRTKSLFGNIFGGVQAVVNLPNVAHLAANLIKKIKADPQAQQAFQEYEASKRAKRIPHLRRRAEKDPTRYLDLYKTLKTISKRFPKCTTGKSCAAQLSKLRADPAIWRHITREKERRFISTFFQRIEQYKKAGLAVKAAEETKRLKKLYPGKSLKELRKMAAK